MCMYRDTSEKWGLSFTYPEKLGQSYTPPPRPHFPECSAYIRFCLFVILQSIVFARHHRESVFAGFCLCSETFNLRKEYISLNRAFKVNIPIRSWCFILSTKTSSVKITVISLGRSVMNGDNSVSRLGVKFYLLIFSTVSEHLCCGDI